MIAAITKDFAFSASHTLNGLPDGHQCGRLHGHNYLVRVEIEGEVNRVGFVIDYGDLAEFGSYINTTLDHRHLNNVIPDLSPTAEHLSRHLAGVLRMVLTKAYPRGRHPTTFAVGVSETPKTWAFYRENW